MNYYDAPFWAEIHNTKNNGSEFKLEKGFQTLEEAKTWIKSKICKSSGRWYIEAGGELVLRGE